MARLYRNNILVYEGTKRQVYNYLRKLIGGELMQLYWMSKVKHVAAGEDSYKEKRISVGDDVYEFKF